LRGKNDRLGGKGRPVAHEGRILPVHEGRRIVSPGPSRLAVNRACHQSWWRSRAPGLDANHV
jgi:hypothetical protein